MPDTLSSAVIDAAYERLCAVGGRPALHHSAERLPMRGDPEALAKLLDDALYSSAMANTYTLRTRNSGLPCVSVQIPPPRKGRKDSTHVPFWRNLPKRRR